MPKSRRAILNVMTLTAALIMAACYGLLLCADAGSEAGCYACTAVGITGLLYWRALRGPIRRLEAEERAARLSAAQRKACAASEAAFRQRIASLPLPSKWHETDGPSDL